VLSDELFFQDVTAVFRFVSALVSGFILHCFEVRLSLHQ